MQTTTLQEIPNIDHLRRSRDQLLMRSKEADRQTELLMESVGKAKARVEDEPEVMTVLEDLQTKEHQRAVGDYEQLLTLLLQDVLPGMREVVLDLRTERGLPALDVFLKKGHDRPLEDALNGTGGSVTNLLSAGLRFIALARSGLRPFLVLDEADCWLEPGQNAANFASIVQQMSEELGVQVLMISHHNDSLLEGVLPHRLRLEVGANGLISQWAPTSIAPHWDEEQQGIRSIELIGFQAHKHTIIPLSPGVTLLQGRNDIGKSAVAKALRAVFYAESNDTYIEHTLSQSRVILDFGPENILSWERNRKGKVKVAYSLTDRNDGSLIHHTEGARGVPQWVKNLGIGLAGDLDIQLVTQQNPVFLLNEKASERAKALAVGDDSSFVQTMLSLSKQELLDARATVRQGEKTLETLYRIRAALEPLKKNQDAWEDIENRLEKLKKLREQSEAFVSVGNRWFKSIVDIETREDLKNTHLPIIPEISINEALPGLLNRWVEASHRSDALEIVSDIALPPLPQEPPTTALQKLLERWNQSIEKSDLLKEIPKQPLDEVIQPDFDVGKAMHLLKKWEKTTNATRLLEAVIDLPDIQAPPTPESHERNVLEKWEGLRLQVSKLEKELEQDVIMSEEIEAQLASEFKECPTCHQSLDQQHHH